MQAVRFTGSEVLVTDTPPERPEGYIRVDVAAAGLCGSDVGFAAAGLDVIPGHEFSGVTEDGRRVAIQPNSHCRSCNACTNGHSNTCPEAFASFAGMVAQDGGLATYAFVNPDRLHELPEDMPVEHGALVEPTAVAWHAVQLLDEAGTGHRIVVGAGTIGLLSALILLERGDDVTVVGRYPHQELAAAKLGVPYLSDANLITEPAAAVLDSAGSQSALDVGIEHLSPRGHLVTLGTNPWQPRLQELFLYKELTIRSSIIYTREDFSESVAFIHRHPAIYSAIVSHHFPLAEAAKAVEAARLSGAHEAIKVLVHP